MTHAHTITLPVAPRLPNATEVFDRHAQEHVYNLLRLYFNTVDNTFAALNAQLGAFSDTTDQPLIAVNTPQAITFNTTDSDAGVVIGSPTSRILLTQSGVYNFQFSIQLVSGTSATRTVSIWPRINGADVPNSATMVTIKSNNDVIVPAWNFVLHVNAGDYFELVWTADGNAITLESVPAQTAPFARPAIPCVILTVIRVVR